MRVVSYVARPGEQGQWFDSDKQYNGNAPMFYATDNATWLGCAVFDGARTFEGVTPDLDLHCARVIESARHLRLAPTITTGEIIKIAQEAISRFPKDALLYVRPEIWATQGVVQAKPDNLGFAMVVHEAPWPKLPFTACFSTYRRPDSRTAPTLAKAIGLYANVSLALAEAKDKGFDTAIKLDLHDYVAEFATANLVIIKDGIVKTPKPNGTFLNGITKQRILGLLMDDGFKVEETILTRPDIMAADEIFSTGNIGKVMPCGRVEDKEFAAPGPVAKRAKELYWDFAHGRLKPKQPVNLVKAA